MGHIVHIKGGQPWSNYRYERNIVKAKALGYSPEKQEVLLGMDVATAKKISIKDFEEIFEVE